MMFILLSHENKKVVLEFGGQKYKQVVDLHVHDILYHSRKNS